MTTIRPHVDDALTEFDVRLGLEEGTVIPGIDVPNPVLGEIEDDILVNAAALDAIRDRAAALDTRLAYVCVDGRSNQKG